MWSLVLKILFEASSLGSKCEWFVNVNTSTRILILAFDVNLKRVLGYNLLSFDST